jgi:flagellar motility protein MotE (MotC chaperone)
MKTFWTFFICGAFLVVLVMGTGIAQGEKSGGGGAETPQVSLEGVAQELQEKTLRLSQQEQVLKDWEERLKVQEERLKTRIAELQKIEAAKQKLSAENKKRQEAVEQNLVKTYESMNPRRAADILSVMEESLAVELLMVMKARNVAQILDKMDPNKAMLLSTKIAERKPASAR